MEKEVLIYVFFLSVPLSYLLRPEVSIALPNCSFIISLLEPSLLKVSRNTLPQFPSRVVATEDYPSRIRTINRRSCLTTLVRKITLWDVKEPTHSSQRVGDIVPGVVVWSCIVITAGPYQQLLPLPNLLYQIKYDMMI